MRPDSDHRDRQNRRRFIQATGTAALAVAFSSGAARAQTARRYAVVSLIGDQLDVVFAGKQTGTLLDPNRHALLADPEGAMDRIALAATARALEADGRSSAALLALPPTPMHEQAEYWVEDKTVSLPGKLVDALELSRATHLVLLTKRRADADIPLLHTRLGVGKLRGLGYYVDPRPRIRMIESNEVAYGVLAPYVYFQLTLADAITGAVLNQRPCASARPYPVASSDTAANPWDVLSAEEKSERLRELLERELARLVPMLVGS
jgi:hypothetical protein